MHRSHFFVSRILLIGSILIYVLAFYHCKPSVKQDTEHVEHYENGQVSRRVMLKDGKKEGKMTDYYATGQRMAERWFTAGKQEGQTMIYYPSGAKKEVQWYKNGAQFGADTIWYEDGKVQFTLEFYNNLKNGYLHKWDSTGALIFESRYSMDTLIEVKGQPIDRNVTPLNNREALKPQKQN